MGLVEAMVPVCRTGGRAIPRGQRLSQGGPAHELAAQLVHAGLECSRRLATETEASSRVRRARQREAARGAARQAAALRRRR